MGKLASLNMMNASISLGKHKSFHKVKNDIEWILVACAPYGMSNLIKGIKDYLRKEEAIIDEEFKNSRGIG